MRKMHWYDTSYFTCMWVKIKSGSKAFQRLGESSPLLWSYCTVSAGNLGWFVFLTLLYRALREKILTLLVIKGWNTSSPHSLVWARAHCVYQCWSLLPSDACNHFSFPIYKRDLCDTGILCQSGFYWNSVPVHGSSYVFFLLHEKKEEKRSLNMKVNQVFFYSKWLFLQAN